MAYLLRSSKPFPHRIISSRHPHLGCRDRDGLPPPAPIAGPVLEHAGACSAAMAATAGAIEIPRGQIVPIAADQQLVAAMTIGALARGIVNIAREHVAQTDLAGDPPRLAQRRGRRRRLV